MSHFLSLTITLVFLISTTACSSLHMKYEADVEVVKNGKSRSGRYEYERSIDTSGHAWACGITAILYGGWCWYYKFMPDDDQKEEMRQLAESNLKEQFDDAKIFVSNDIAYKIRWADGPLRYDLDLKPTKPGQ